MKSSSLVEAEQRNDVTVLTTLRSEPPVALRPTSTGLAIVGSAAAPVGGDELTLQVAIGAGATLQIEAVAATMAWPASVPAPSMQTLEIHVAEGGHLRWGGQPLLPVQGCHHLQRITIDLAPGATLDFTDEVALGRSGEEPGRLDARLRVTRGGQPLIDHHQIYDPSEPGWNTSAGLADVRFVRQHLVVGPPAHGPFTTIGDSESVAGIVLAPDAQFTMSITSRQTQPATPEMSDSEPTIHH